MSSRVEGLCNARRRLPPHLSTTYTAVIPTISTSAGSSGAPTARPRQDDRCRKQSSLLGKPPLSASRSTATATRRGTLPTARCGRPPPPARTALDSPRQTTAACRRPPRAAAAAPRDASRRATTRHVATAGATRRHGGGGAFTTTAATLCPRHHLRVCRACAARHGVRAAAAGAATVFPPGPPRCSHGQGARRGDDGAPGALHRRRVGWPPPAGGRRFSLGGSQRARRTRAREGAGGVSTQTPGGRGSAPYARRVGWLRCGRHRRRCRARPATAPARRGQAVRSGGYRPQALTLKPK